MKESAIEKKLLEGARRLGYKAYKFVSPGNDGVPDRIVMGYGRTIFAELKTEKGRPSRIQKVQIRVLQNLGQDVRVLYGSKGVEEFLQDLAAYKLRYDLEEIYREEARP